MNSNPKHAITGQDPTIRRARSQTYRRDDADAFVPDPTDKHGGIRANDAESFAEEFIATATTGEQVEMEAQNEVIEEEFGGPFVALDAENDEETEMVIPEPMQMSQLAGVRRRPR